MSRCIINIELSKVIAAFAVLILLGTSTTLYAQKGEYYFCGAKVDSHKKYFFTELFEGGVKISSTVEVRKHLIEKYKLSEVKVECTGYGNSAQPVDKKLAEKLQQMDIRKNGIMLEAEQLDWKP